VLAALSLSGGCGVLTADPSELFAVQAGDGGVESDAPCLETARPVTGNDQTVIGATAYELLALVQGDHGGSFLWVTGDKTRITVSVDNPQVFSVVSRTNPAGDTPYGERHCANYARIDATVRLRTVDGRLDETFDKVSMTAFSGDEVRGALTVPSAELHGTYTPSLRREHCHASSSLRFLIAVDGTHGSLTDALGSGACHADAAVFGTSQFAGGRWGARWQNY